LAIIPDVVFEPRVGRMLSARPFDLERARLVIAFRRGEWLVAPPSATTSGRVTPMRGLKS
jgi:hypothetical protein